MLSKISLVDLFGSSLKPIDYAISLIPQERFLTPPPHGKHANAERGFKTYFGEYSAARLMFHLVFYERQYAIPAMEHWLGEPHPHFDLAFPDFALEESAWGNADPEELSAVSLIQELRSLRSEQILITEAVPESDLFAERITTSLGKFSFVTVVLKTIQHTFEHGSDLFKNALYWNGALEWLDRQG